MTYPRIPSQGTIVDHFVGSLRTAKRKEDPYLRWDLTHVLQESLCTAILVLPIVPPMLGSTDGTRNSYNARRTFITPALREKFPVCGQLTEALRHPDVAHQFQETCKIDARGTFLRVEYMQDTEGMWLEPHRDIPEKIFSMVVYLCTGPDAKDWGTDIYDAQKNWAGRSSARFNTATIFKAGPNTWHGFEKRPINGVRRLMEVNYVRDWKDREQLAFPDRPILL